MESERLRVAAASPGTPGTPGTPSTPGTPGPTPGSAAANGNSGGSLNQTMAGLPQDPKTREEILRERYLKGLKKRKCTVCGNTARARCPYRACKTCCSKAQNPCTVHVLKPGGKKNPEAAAAHASLNAPSPANSEQAWLGQNMQAPMGSGYLRPGYSVPSPYNGPNAMGMDPAAPMDASTAAAKKYMSTGTRSWGSSPLSEQQELQRQRNLRIAAQKEAIMTNIWRLQKVKDYGTAERAAEDEAFDRYCKNASLLEDVFALRTRPLQGIDADGELIEKEEDGRAKEPEATEAQDGMVVDDDSLLDAMRTRVAADFQKKAASRLRLKQVIERAVRKLRTGDQEPTESIIADEGDGHNAGVSWASMSEKRWEPKSKRLKSWTEEGKQVLKTMETFDGLLQKVQNIKTPEDIQECMDLYQKKLGGNLSYLVPNLHPREDAEDNARDSTTSGSVEKNADDSLTSPRAALLNYLSGAYLEANPEGHVVVSNRNVGVPSAESRGNSHKVKERPWDSGVERMERLYWHRKYLRGMGWWKVYAHDETIHRMCFERANANTTILEL